MDLQQIQHELITAPHRFTAIHQGQHHIHFADAVARGFHQPLAEQVMGFVDAGGVHQHQLGALSREDGPQTVAGGLRHRRGDRHLLPHQLVEQRGFAHVGAPHQGHKPRAKALRGVAQY